MKQNNQKHNQKNTNKNIEITTTTSKKKKSWSFSPILIAFLAPVLLYLQTITFDFTHFDDNDLITKNINYLSNFKNVANVFTKDATINNSSPFYRPLQTLSYMTDIKLSGGDNAWMYHLTNILLLGLISLLLFLLLQKFLIPQTLALISTLIFVAHPLFVSNTAWLPARGDLMLVVFSLLSFLFLIYFLQKKKIKYLLLHWSVFVLALFSKETAAILPLLFILHFFIFYYKKNFNKIYLINILLYILISIFWFWVRSKAIVSLLNWNNQLGVKAILFNLQTIPESLTKFFFPFFLASIPSFSIIKSFIGILILALIIYLLIKTKASLRKEKLFGLIWFLLLLLPSMFYKHALIDYLDHHFFLPMIGILLFVLLLLPKKWFAVGDIKKPYILVIILAFLCCITIFKTRSYTDSTLFYDKAISLNPNSIAAYINRGDLRSDSKDFIHAIEDYDKAIAINHTLNDVYFKRGFIKKTLGDKTGAIADFDTAISLNNKPIEYYYCRGVTYITSSKFKEAIADLNKCIISNPNIPEPYYFRGIAYLYISNFIEAIADFNKNLTFQPSNADTYFFKGMALNSLNNYREAIYNFTKAIEINPKNLGAYYNRALALYNLKDIKGAIEDCDIVLKSDPNNKLVIDLKTKAEKELK